VTLCLQRRFEVGVRLLFPWQNPVSTSSGYRPVSLVSASFWHATGTTSLEGFRVRVRLLPWFVSAAFSSPFGLSRRLLLGASHP
jgi:hypothetical protein